MGPRGHFEEPDDSSWERHRLLQLDINKRHQEWLLKQDSDISELKLKMAVFKTQMAMICAVAGLLASIAGNFISKALGATH